MTLPPNQRPQGAPVNPSFLCMKCGKELKNIDTALHKKLINRGAKQFMCMDCLGEYVGLTHEQLLQKAEQFKKDGCTLFL